MQNNTQDSWEEEFKKMFGSFESNYHLGSPEQIKSFIRSILSKQAEEISEKYLQALKEPEEWCLQHYGYATKEQEEEIYKEGMDAMRAYKTIRFLAIKQVINK